MDYIDKNRNERGSESGSKSRSSREHHVHTRHKSTVIVPSPIKRRNAYFSKKNVLHSKVPYHEHKVRLRNFEFGHNREISKLFQGLSFNQYSNTILREPLMQKVVVRDQLFILTDKLIGVKASLTDGVFQTKIIHELRYSNLRRINECIETIISHINLVCHLLMYGMLT